MRPVFSLMIVCGLTAVLSHAASAQDAATEKEPQSAGDFAVTTIDGDEVRLGEKYEGKVLLVVNVASRCGLTPQYTALQELHESHQERGLAILAFPSNQFGGQEPGTNEEIATFCSDNYDVTFDLFSKIDVNGDNAHPFYAWLTSQKTAPKESGDISWNFEKFVVDRNGNVIARFSPRTSPDDKELLETIDGALDE